MGVVPPRDRDAPFKGRRVFRQTRTDECTSTTSKCCGTATVVSAERSVRLVDPRAAWPVGRPARQPSPPAGCKIRVKDEPGRIVILTGVVSVLRHARELRGLRREGRARSPDPLALAAAVLRSASRIGGSNTRARAPHRRDRSARAPAAPPRDCERSARRRCWRNRRRHQPAARTPPAAGTLRAGRVRSGRRIAPEGRGPDPSPGPGRRAWSEGPAAGIRRREPRVDARGRGRRGAARRRRRRSRGRLVARAARPASFRTGPADGPNRRAPRTLRAPARPALRSRRRRGGRRPTSGEKGSDGPEHEQTCLTGLGRRHGGGPRRRGAEGRARPGSPNGRPSPTWREFCIEPSDKDERGGGKTP